MDLNPLDRPLDEEEINGNFRKVYLYGEKGRGMYAKVDPEKYPEVIQYRWYLAKDKGCLYAVSPQKRNGKNMIIKMHRLITDAPQGYVVDHINHDGLDNRLANLRLCTNKQNFQNRDSLPGSSSKYCGVSYDKVKGLWRARITAFGEYIELGYYSTEKDAGLAVDYYARKYKGEFANLNFPDEYVTEDYIKHARKQLPPQTSRFYGVYWNSTTGKWVSCVLVNGKQIRRFFDSEIEAALVRDMMVRQYNLRRSKLNFPDITDYSDIPSLVTQLSK